MRKDQIRKYDMLRRVQQHLDQNATQLGNVNASQARKALDALVQEMGDSEAEQASASLNAKAHTSSQKALRAELVVHHMRPVATIAAAHLRDVPGFTAFTMPSSNVKVAVLVQSATAMAEAAREYTQVFVDNGLPVNFADDLVAAAAAVRASIDARATVIADRASARDGLKDASTRSYLVLKMLDAQVEKAIGNDPKALAGWKSVKRIGKGKVVPIEATIPAPATPLVAAPAVVPQAKAA